VIRVVNLQLKIVKKYPATTCFAGPSAEKRINLVTGNRNQVMLQISNMGKMCSLVPEDTKYLLDYVISKIRRAKIAVGSSEHDPGVAVISRSKCTLISFRKSSEYIFRKIGSGIFHASQQMV